MIKAVIFDMDGLLIDSEPFWRKADIDIFGTMGITLTEEDCATTAGMRVDEVVRHWAIKNPDVKISEKKIEKEIIEYVGNLIDKKGVAMNGATSVISFFKNKNIQLALASASSSYLINKVLVRLKLASEFSVIKSAEFMAYGKPHPEIFLETAKELNIRPEACLVFEDSVFGVIAAKAAKMQVVAVPDKENFNKNGYSIADLKLKSLDDFSNKTWNDLILNKGR